jgi:DNA-binding GntR family transcriptional regulator
MLTYLRPEVGSVAQRLAREVEASIRAGTLPPFHRLALRSMAEQHNLKLPALVLALTGLVREGLLIIYGSTAVVSALCPDELSRIRELRSALLPHLFERAHRDIAPEELDRLEQLLHSIDPRFAGPVDPDTWVSTMREFVLGLARPTATHTEMLTVEDVLSTTARYQALGWQQIGLSGDGGMRLRHQHLTNCVSLVDSFRSARPRVIRELTLQRDNEVHYVAEVGLAAYQLGHRAHLAVV